MNKKIVVESTLKSHIDYLEQGGYEVHKLYKNENLNNITSFDYDGIVVEDLSNINMETSTSYRPGAPVVEAKDKTPEEVFNILRSRY